MPGPCGCWEGPGRQAGNGTGRLPGQVEVSQAALCSNPNLFPWPPGAPPLLPPLPTCHRAPPSRPPHAPTPPPGHDRPQPLTPPPPPLDLCCSALHSSAAAVPTGWPACLLPGGELTPLPPAIAGCLPGRGGAAWQAVVVRLGGGAKDAGGALSSKVPPPRRYTSAFALCYQYHQLTDLVFSVNMQLNMALHRR